MAGLGLVHGDLSPYNTLVTGLGGGEPCSSPTFTPPVVEYDHDTGCSITGGEVYRGSGLPDWVRGRYVFGDFCTGAVYALGGGPPTAAWSREPTSAPTVPGSARRSRAPTAGTTSSPCRRPVPGASPSSRR